MTDLHWFEVSHRRHVDIGGSVRSLAREAQRCAGTIDAHRTEHGRIVFDRIDMVHGDVDNVELRAGAFGFGEVDLLAVGGPAGDSWCAVERSEQHFWLAAVRGKDLNRRRVGPTRRI